MRKYSGWEHARPVEHYRRGGTTLRFPLHYCAWNGCDEASLHSMQFLDEAKTLFVVSTGEIRRGGSGGRTQGREQLSRNARGRCLRLELHCRFFQLVYKLLVLENICALNDYINCNMNRIFVSPIDFNRFFRNGSKFNCHCQVIFFLTRYHREITLYPRK